jgi:hypothetical protein
MLARRDGERLLFGDPSGVMEDEFGLHEKRGAVDGQLADESNRYCKSKASENFNGTVSWVR